MAKKILMGGKKGVELTGETLGVLLALVILLGIALLVVKVVNLFSSQAEKNAESFIDGLAEKINAFLEIGDIQSGIQASPSDSVNLTVQGFKGDWAVMGWDIDDLIADGKPEKQACFGKGCLCICEKKDSKIDCQERGYCREIKANNIDVYSRLTFDVNEVGSIYNEGLIEAKCIFIKDKLMGILVTKENGKIEIKYDYGMYDKPSEIDAFYNRLKLCKGYNIDDEPIVGIPTISG